MSLTQEQEDQLKTALPQLLKLIETVPAINSKLVSIEAIVSTISATPVGAAIENEAMAYVIDHIGALESWAQRVFGGSVHNSFTPSGTPAPSSGTEGDPAPVQQPQGGAGSGGAAVKVA